MPRPLTQEDGNLLVLEDGSGYLVLEIDWDNQPGDGVGSWTQASDASSAAWTPIAVTESTWTPVDDGN